MHELITSSWTVIYICGLVAIIVAGFFAKLSGHVERAVQTDAIGIAAVTLWPLLSALLALAALLSTLSTSAGFINQMSRDSLFSSKTNGSKKYE